MSALFLAATAIPRSGDASQLFTLRNAIDTALQRSYVIEVGKNEIANAEIGVREAVQQFLPDLRLSASAQRYYGRFFSDIDGRIVDQSTDSVFLSAGSSISLFNGFRDVSVLRAARSSRDAEAARFARSRERLVLVVLTNYLGLLQEREQLRVMRENQLAQSKLLDQVKVYVEGGTRTTADLYSQEAALAKANVAVVDSMRSSESAVVELIRALNLDPREQYEFVDVGEPTSSVDLSEPFEVLAAAALATRKDLLAQEARVTAALANVRVAKAAYWPTLALDSSYGSGFTSVPALTQSEQLNLNRTGSVGITMSVPIFDRGAAHSASLRSALQAQRARIELENTRREVELEVRTAIQELRSAAAQLQAVELQQRAASMAVEAQDVKYEAGASTLVELAQAQAAWVEAQSAVVDAKYNMSVRRAYLRYAVGSLSAETLF